MSTTGLAASLTHTTGSVDYITSVLRLLSAVFKHPSPDAAQAGFLEGMDCIISV
jgi:hypothetical protein